MLDPDESRASSSSCLLAAIDFCFCFRDFFFFFFSLPWFLTAAWADRSSLCDGYGLSHIFKSFPITQAHLWHIFMWKCSCFKWQYEYILITLSLGSNHRRWIKMQTAPHQQNSTSQQSVCPFNRVCENRASQKTLPLFSEWCSPWYVTLPGQFRIVIYGQDWNSVTCSK